MPYRLPPSCNVLSFFDTWQMFCSLELAKIQGRMFKSIERGQRAVIKEKDTPVLLLQDISSPLFSHPTTYDRKSSQKGSQDDVGKG